MASTPSHRLKLQRAEKHLADLETLIAGVQQRRPYPVIEAFDAESNQWAYRLCLDEIHPPETFSIILGDFLFNTRSALDHLVVAIAPAKFKRQVSFPIFVADPLATDKHTGAYLDAEARSRWLSRTAGLPSDCVAALRALQPYEVARESSKPAADHPAAILSALQNADKHRNLVTVISGLRDLEAWVDGAECNVSFPSAGNPAVKNGALVYSSPEPVKVQIEGAALIGIGRPDESRDFHKVTDSLIGHLTGEVFPSLEPFLPGGSRAVGHQAAPPTG